MHNSACCVLSTLRPHVILTTKLPLTGASRGIGQAIAETMAEEGANLILLAQRKGALEEVSARFICSNNFASVPCITQTLFNRCIMPTSC